MVITRQIWGSTLPYLFGVVVIGLSLSLYQWHIRLKPIPHHEQLIQIVREESQRGLRSQNPEHVRLISQVNQFLRRSLTHQLTADTAEMIAVEPVNALLLDRAIRQGLLSELREERQQEIDEVAEAFIAVRVLNEGHFPPPPDHGWWGNGTLRAFYLQSIRMDLEAGHFGDLTRYAEYLAAIPENYFFGQENASLLSAIFVAMRTSSLSSLERKGLIRDLALSVPNDREMVFFQPPLTVIFEPWEMAFISPLIRSARMSQANVVRFGHQAIPHLWYLDRSLSQRRIEECYRNDRWSLINSIISDRGDELPLAARPYLHLLFNDFLLSKVSYATSLNAGYITLEMMINYIERMGEAPQDIDALFADFDLSDRLLAWRQSPFIESIDVLDGDPTVGNFRFLFPRIVGLTSFSRVDEDRVVGFFLESNIPENRTQFLRQLRGGFEKVAKAEIESLKMLEFGAFGGGVFSDWQPISLDPADEQVALEFIDRSQHAKIFMLTLRMPRSVPMVLVQTNPLAERQFTVIDSHLLTNRNNIVRHVDPNSKELETLPFVFFP